MKYGYSRRVDDEFEAAIEKVTAVLAEEGFGVLTTIDVKATLKKKLDVETRPYVILGACNPNFAHEAMQRETELGLLLPCNVIVYEDDAGATHVAAIDAHAMLSVVDNEELHAIAGQVNDRLRAAVDRL